MAVPKLTSLRRRLQEIIDDVRASDLEIRHGFRTALMIVDKTHVVKTQLLKDRGM